MIVVDIDFNDINQERAYSPFKSYGRSKLANILFTKALAHRLKGMAKTGYAYCYSSKIDHIYI
jgi:NAD(P)-dependent dehydrogenase (short-subunit alcohol dehydrogenase family)